MYINNKENKILKKNYNISEDALLLKKLILDEATKEEKLRAEKLLASNPKLRKQFDLLRKKSVLDESFNHYNKYSGKKAYNNFLYVVKNKRRVIVYRTKERLLWYSAAAVAAIVIGLFLWTQPNVFESKQQLALSSKTFNNNTNHSSLIRTANLSNALNKVPTGNANVTVVKNIRHNYFGTLLSQSSTANSKLVGKADSTEQQQSVKYNNDVIPRGQEKLVKLPDGTTVYMNAASTLTYPTAFTGKERVVMLKGEAYFDVTKDPEHPFIVETKFGDVKVLGTAFDINAYDDLGKCYTTLVRGKVQLTTKDDITVMLTPGQQAVVSSSGDVSKRSVDVTDYVSWMAGTYRFENTPLKEIMMIVERTYDVHVVFEDKSLNNINYSGTVLRYPSVNAFLDVFESVGDLTYRIKGRTVYINKE
jgi:transmembrane sensor